MTAVAAWISTSSSRLSYMGVQFAFAFYLIHLGEFTILTNLAVARDRVLGVFLGTTMMWLVFERLFPRSAADEMVRIFARNVRSMSDLLLFTPRRGDPDAILSVRRMREDIYRRFGEVNAQSDAVPFETGPLRPGDMAARDRVRRWQASLRSFYLLEAPLLQFRLFGDYRFEVDILHCIRRPIFGLSVREFFRQIAENLESQRASRVHMGRQTISLVHRIDKGPPETLENSRSASRGWHVSCVSLRSLLIACSLRSLLKGSTMCFRLPSRDRQGTKMLRSVRIWRL